MQRTFNELDHDGNGVVTVAELSGWVPTGGNGGAQIDKRDLVRACQRSENGELDYFQFLQAWQAARVEFDAPRPASAPLPPGVAPGPAARPERAKPATAAALATALGAEMLVGQKRSLAAALGAETLAKVGDVGWSSFRQVAGLTSNEEYEVPTRMGLITIEAKRKELLERSKHGRLIVLFSWTGTILNWATASVQLWSALIVFVLTRVYMREVAWDPGNLPRMSMEQVSIISGFLFFFLIFYVSHCYARFDQQYSASMSIEGRIFDLVTMARSCMPQASAHRLMRQLNGAHALGYVGLGPTYSLDNFLRHYQRQHQLFSIAEWQRLRKIGVDGNGNAYREAVA